jgi:hypothetical protein
MSNQIEKHAVVWVEQDFVEEIKRIEKLFDSKNEAMAAADEMDREHRKVNRDALCGYKYARQVNGEWYTLAQYTPAESDEMIAAYTAE